MASIEIIKGSDGTGNADMATVQSVRAPLASTIVVDTVLGINPAGFSGTMGTPHTFTDPVTSETITVISEATAVDFTGHIDGGNIEIDTIAPGYTDAGSEVGDIVIIRPTTQYADNLASVLEVSHNDDGSLVGAAVRTALGESVPSGPGWTDLADTPDTVTANGNRSYALVFNGNDLTDTVSPGMRLKLTRTVTAPTYAGGAFNGSSHYFTKTSPTGTLSTVTNNFTLMCHYEPTSYASMALMGRLDSTPNNGIYLRVTASGQVGVVVHNGGAANYRAIDTYQSLPLNKKTHIAASWTGGTVVIYFDGVSVPVQAAQTGGTAPTTAGTGGDWSIGRGGAYATLYANGYISNVGAFDAVLTASTIKSYMSQKLAGNETNCIGAWALNNNGTDDNSAGNTVTATGGVSYTNNKAPFTQDVTGTSVTAGTTNYAIITKASFSTNTTLTVQVPEGDTIPTSGGVSAVSYSTQKVPYGFPSQRGKWPIITFLNSDYSVGTTANTWYGALFYLTIPTGDWSVTYNIVHNRSVAATAYSDIKATLSTTTSTETDPYWTDGQVYGVLSNTLITRGAHTRTGEITTTTQTPYYGLVQNANNNSDTQAIGQYSRLTAYPAYL